MPRSTEAEGRDRRKGFEGLDCVNHGQAASCKPKASIDAKASKARRRREAAAKRLRRTTSRGSQFGAFQHHAFSRTGLGGRPRSPRDQRRRRPKTAIDGGRKPRGGRQVATAKDPRSDGRLVLFSTARLKDRTWREAAAIEDDRRLRRPNRDRRQRPKAARRLRSSHGEEAAKQQAAGVFLAPRV